MKIRFSLYSSVMLLGLSASNLGAALIAAWNFNGLSIATAGAPGAAGVPTSIPADSGTGTVGLADWTGLVDDFAGTTLNALNADPSEESLSLVSNAGNGSFITISFSMTGLENPAVTFATRGTSTGYNSGIWSWSIDGTNFSPVPGTTASVATSFALASVDFSDINDLDGAAAVTLRYTLSGATSTTGNNRIDNLQINTVPEPAAALLGALGVIGLLRRRRSN
jgi:MYXO-CTERM domain-containing protein